MRNEDSWVPTRFESTASGWRGSRDPAHLAVSSRITADSAVRYYEDYLRRHSKGRLLDLGCGNAPLYGIYRELVTEVTCLDWSASEHSSHHVDVTADLNGPLPLDDGAFDTILSTSVLEHLRRPEVALDEVFRVLAPGGTAIIAAPFLYPIHESPHDYYRYTKFCLVDMCAECGLDLVELQEFGGRAEVVCDLMSKMLGGTPWLCRPFVSTCQLGLRATRRWRGGSAESFPLGYCLAARKAS